VAFTSPHIINQSKGRRIVKEITVAMKVPHLLISVIFAIFDIFFEFLVRKTASGESVTSVPKNESACRLVARRCSSL
jgi:ribose/xylose/arabinose/galactoside ABC-type transport system permease subunit